MPGRLRSAPDTGSALRLLGDVDKVRAASSQRTGSGLLVLGSCCPYEEMPGGGDHADNSADAVLRACGESRRRDPEIVYMESDEASGASLRVRGNRAVLASPRVTWRVIPACAGTVRPLRRWSQRHRVIPACAGNSELGVELPCVLAGHPCVCGEQVEPAMFERLLDGSSLRVRGTDCVSWCAIEFSCQIQTL